MKYTIPFTMPMDMTAVEVCDLLKKHNIRIGAQLSYVNDEFLIQGTMENLIKFFEELDGPGQSFPISEFKEYVRQNNLSNCLKTYSLCNAI